MHLRSLFIVPICLVAVFAMAQTPETPPPIESFVVVQQDGARHTLMMKSGKQIVVIEHRNGFEIRRPKTAEPAPVGRPVDPNDRRFFMSLAEARQGDGEAMELFRWVQDQGLRKHGPAGFGSLSRRGGAGPGSFGPGSFGPGSFGPDRFGPSLIGPSTFAPPEFGPKNAERIDGSAMLDRMNQSTMQGMSDMMKRQQEAAEKAKQRGDDMKRLQDKLKRSTRLGF